MDTSYLTQQVTTIIGQLHNLFDEIGVPSHERESRESELFSSLSETLHNHLRPVASEKNELIEEGQRIITTIRQMEASLDDTKADGPYATKQADLKVTYPLVECVQALKEKHRAISKLHQERYEQVKKLCEALAAYSSHLGPTFLQIKLPLVASDGTIPPTFDLSPSYIFSVDSEFTRVYEEYARRCAIVSQLAEAIVMLWAELGTPQAQTEEAIVQCQSGAPEQLGLQEDDINRLRKKHEKLLEEKRGREKRTKELKSTVESLWNRLGVEEHERKAFLAGVRGCGLRAINDLEDELSRLNELKRQNLHLFVEDARTRLQTLWDELYISEEEAINFTPMFCDVYSDALLSAHESEIVKLEMLKERRAPTLQLINKHRSLIKDRENLAASSQDASRLMLKPQKGEKRDPTRLLREEKMRKRIAKELPKVEQELAKLLEDWEEEYGRPFLVFGDRYLDNLSVATASSKPASSRSKTPNAQVPAKVVGSATSAPRAPAARELSSTIRSKTPVGTITRNPSGYPRSATLSTNRSPSRIPSRLPLGASQHGGNSPERRHGHLTSQGKENSTIKRKADQPVVAPPPKMRDISTPSTTYANDFSLSGSIVRHIPPEDPYQDRNDFNKSHLSSLSRPLLQTQMAPPPRPAYNSAYQNKYPPAVSVIPSLTSSFSSSRQPSTNSTFSDDTSHSAVISGNENWMAYGDGNEEDEELSEEPEVDARDVYWGKVISQQQQSRGTEMQMQMKGRIEVLGRHGQGQGGREGSETVWTDTDDGVE